MKTNLTAASQKQYLVDLSRKFGSDKEQFCSTYEEYLSDSRDNEINFFEIGVGGYEDPKAGGASLRMWETYFPNAKVYALDYYDKQSHSSNRVKIYQGSQDDEQLLKKIANDIGRVDVVLDDGSHHSPHIIKSFEVLFPLLASGGLYIVEDVGTSYWPEWGGSLDFSSTKSTMGYFKRLADGLNCRHFIHDYKPNQYEASVRFIHFYDNLIVIRKA